MFTNSQLWNVIKTKYKPFKSIKYNLNQEVLIIDNINILVIILNINNIYQSLSLTLYQ